MNTRKISSIALATAAALTVAASLSAHAQGTIRGAEDGAAQGGAAAGPLGAVVGGAVGAATGTVGGILGVDERPRFREYVEREHRPSYRYRGDLATGVVLPEAGVTYYEVPTEYHVRGYRYAVVNDRTVLVDPRTHRIVEVLD